MDVDAGAALLRDEADRAALAADDGADHVALHQEPEREVGGTRAAASSSAAATAAAATGPAAPTAPGILLYCFYF